MSTIEKAAERLSARRKGESGQKPLVGAGSPHGVTEAIEALPTRTNGARARTTGRIPASVVADRFCEIDLEAIQERGFLTPKIGRSQLAGEMRRIKRPLLLNIHKGMVNEDDGAPPANLIMITSALPGEGKTFTSINLAMSVAAELDRRVLLVDADVARGDVSQQLGLTPHRGLSNLLEEHGYLREDAVLDTNVERLSVLPAGPPSDHIDELFASDMMTTLTRSLAEEDPSRVIIFDASPLLATTEAAVLARQMGQTVVVIEASKTPQDAVAQALAHLEGCANVSLVLNKTTGRASGDYHYGYGYGSYGTDGAEPRPTAE